MSDVGSKASAPDRTGHDLLHSMLPLPGLLGKHMEANSLGAQAGGFESREERQSSF